MTKYLLAITTAALLYISANAQEKNPLINSGEIISEGIKLHDAGKYKEAIELYQKINRNDSNFVYALYEKSLSYSADSQYNAALEACKLGLAEDSMHERWPDFFTQYGSLLDNLGKPEESLHVFDSAIALYPNHSLLYLNKGTTLLGMKRYEEAEKLFQYVLVQDPFTASCHYKLGVALLQLGKIVPATYAFMNYLLIFPSGRYSNNCISYLSEIANNTDLITGFIEARTAEPDEEYQLVEKIILSKIALDKNYKPLLQLDDRISRQLQVLLEKTPYSSQSPDFCMQYYVPLYKKWFNAGKFEVLINHIFSAVDLPVIQNYNKKNKKEIEAFTNEAVAYFQQIQTTRQLNYQLRDTAEKKYYYENGVVLGKGKIGTGPTNFIGDWRFFYPGGNLKSTGRYNEKGGKEGKWLYYYPNGRLKVTQTFANDELEGPEVYYFANGVVSSMANYKNGKTEGEAKFYYYCGSPKVSAQYVHDNLNGTRLSYFSNGMLSTSETYSNDKLDGPFSTFHKNGLRASTGTYAAGSLEGPYQEWFDNGQLSAEGQYTKNIETGNWKRYYSNGQLKSTQVYATGRDESDYTEYHENGKLFFACKYKKKTISGAVTYFDDDAKPFAMYEFDKSKPLTARYLNKSGKEISFAQVKDKKMDLTTYRANGIKKSHITYNSDGNSEGLETIYFSNGAVYQTNEYSNGQLNGSSTTFYLNGKPSNITHYSNGSKDGYSTSYYSNGQVQSEGWYQNNMAEGNWLSYDELGKPLAIDYFYNDNQHGHKLEFYKNGQVEYDTRYHMGFIESMTQYDSSGHVINVVKMQQSSGLFTGLQLNGKLKFKGNYEKGDFHGPYSFWYFDGSPHTVQYYNKGAEDSSYTSYFYGGQLYMEGKYKLGKKTGVWKTYRKDGSIVGVENYTNGELTGHSISYFENGKIELDVSYHEGERNGETKKYAPGGELAFSIMYKDDLPISYSYNGKDGKMLPPIELVGGSGKVKSFYANGQLAADYEYIEGKVQGKYQLFFPNGKTWTERADDNGETNGPLAQYYENGQLKAIYQYLNDNLHGPYKEYNQHGVLTEEGNFYNGNYHGNVKLYDAGGKLTETDVYYYGNLLTIKK
ncbi:MAG TPA: tetratricopeptide repeat protein [Chitinophagaceae bacterium]|nr:tetratricopeptide repeat protein [Chitinophagaceae bacterium]